MAKKKILHKIDPNLSFIENLGCIIIDEHIDSIDKLRIILPTGSLCSELKDFLAKNLEGTCVLPFICKIDDFYDGSKFVFTDKLRANPLEERLILTNIILKYQNLAKSFCSAYNMSKNLLEIFSQIHLNDLSVGDLKNYYFGEYSEYLVTIFNFVEEIFIEFESRLLSINKISTFAYKKLFFELFRQKNDEHFIIAGIFNLDSVFLNFANNLHSVDFVYINSKNEFLNGYLVNFKVDKTNYISSTKTSDKKTSEKSSNSLNYISLNYMEFENEYDEAKTVANLINEILTKNKNAKIAIINKDPKVDKILEANLGYFGVNVISNTKLKANESSIFNLFIDLAMFITAFSYDSQITVPDIVKFLDIINNKYVDEENTKLFEFEIRSFLTKNNQEINFSEILSRYEKLSILYKILIQCKDEVNRAVELEDFNFKKILILNLQCLEKICKSYPWRFEIGSFLSKFFNKIIKYSNYINISNLDEYLYVIKSLFRNSVYKNNNKVENETSDRVFSLSVEEAFALDFDYIFIMDFNECSWDKNLNETILPKKVIHELNIPLKYKKEFSELLINFCLFKSNVYISRSLFKASKSTNKSSFLLKIINSSFFKENFVQKNILYKNHTKKHEIDTLGEKTIQFPKNISISSVEKLINDPYSFYVEKILNLKKLEPIEKDLTMADFGNIIHYAIDEYTKNYPLAEEIDQILEKKFSKLPNIYKTLWYKKAFNILNDFIVFDLKRRTQKKIIKSEVGGMLKIKDDFGEMNIICRADRIEIINNHISIIDFKTGAVPSLTKVKQGKFPQLIIESLISKQNGFGIGFEIFAKELIYVKFSYREYKMDIVEIDISDDEYAEHEFHLRKLVNHFVRIKDPNRYPKIKSEDARFDNFMHLRR